MNVRERYALRARAEEDLQFRVAFTAKCMRDPAFWINTCCWTFDPRLPKERRHAPFLLFPRQEEYVCRLRDSLTREYDLLTEKSRDMGATWMVLAMLAHGWLFEEGFAALVGSRKVDYVDKAGDPSTHFWKLLYMIQNQPPWLVPDGWKAQAPHRTYLKVANPMNGSVITGEAASPDFGRGGRYKCAFLDEFASWEWSGAAWTACGESTRCRWPVSTPKGMEFFGRLANPRGDGARIAKERLHWTQDARHARQEVDPETGETFYPYLRKAQERYAYDVTMLAQEIEIDYQRSVRGRVYPQIDFAVVGRYRYDPGLPLYVTLDFGRTDDTAMLWLQWTGSRYRFIDAFSKSGQTIDFFVPFITGTAPLNTPFSYTPEEAARIASHADWIVQAVFGDPAGRQKNQVTNTSVIEELAKPRPGAPGGIHVITNTKALKFETRWQATRMMLAKRVEVDEVKCAPFLDAMRNAKFPDTSESPNTTQEPNKPVHDWTSHYRTACEFMAVNDPHRYQAWADAGEAPDEEEAWEDEDDPMMKSRGIAGY